MTSVILIVLYKETLNSSKTVTSLLANCKRILQGKNILVTIWDNSPQMIDKNDFSCFEDCSIRYKYYHTPENLSLSKIYNNVIDLHIEYDFLFIFDQDSYITLDYFSKIETAISTNFKINLFLPYVVINNLFVSPGDWGLYNGKYWTKKATGLISAKNRVAIASGMAIRFNCFNDQKIRFDENLSLYGVDTKFCLDYSKQNVFFYVIDYQLSHSLSIFEDEPNEIKMKRLLSYGGSLKYILKKKNFIGYLIATVVHTLKRIRLQVLIIKDRKQNL